MSISKKKNRYKVLYRGEILPGSFQTMEEAKKAEMEFVEEVDKRRPKKKLDLTGKKFGRLFVLCEDPEPYISPKGVKTRRWRCRCDCGNEIVVLQNALTSKKDPTTSCGCSRRDYGEDLTGQRFGRLVAVKKVFLDKKESNGVVSGWLCKCDCGNEAVASAKHLKLGETQSCGCLLSEAARAKTVDDNIFGHVESTALSLLKINGKPRKNNKSGVTGVYWNKRAERWIAKIGFQGKDITLGRFVKKEDAISARKVAEEKYFKPMLDKYGWENKKD